MFDVLYIIWFLLPLLFCLLGIWSMLKPYLKYQGKDHTLDYFVQGFFCLVGLGIAIAIDKTAAFHHFIQTFSFWKIDLSVARWLLYPAVLLLMAYGHHLFTRKKEPPRVMPKRSTY